MDLDDCDVLTGWDQPEKSPQRLVSDQVYGTPASTPFSNFVATADPLVCSSVMVVFTIYVESQLSRVVATCSHLPRVPH